MLENVSIIIPFQTDHGPRAKAFEWIKSYYARVMPEAELCLGIINGEDINKSKAVNLAAKKATKDIFVIADADVIYSPNIIVEAIRLLDKSAWVVPFTEVYNIEWQGTERLLNTKPKWPIDVKYGEYTKSNWVYEGFAGKLFVIPRVNFEAVGGFDERFIGWGGEDDAFSHAVRTLCGEIVNIKGKIFHVWHPSSNYQTNPNGKANADLLGRYERASGNKKKMTQLIYERKNNQEKIKNNIQSGGQRQPVIRDKNDHVRKLIQSIESEHNTNIKQYKSKKYPWYEVQPNNYSISIPIKSNFGNLELIVRSDSSLTHYWRHPNGKWYRSETFTKGVKGNPIFFENKSGQFVVICKLKTGGVGFWLRDNKAHGYPWYGPTVFLHKNVDPIMVSRLQDGSHIIVYQSNNQIFYQELDKHKWHKIFPK
ncbi:galactosyltransferase-related protein [Bacillus salipaludis]|uniref:Galactosyltransferase-related protein n=1 Tax=Bacillus salipaludis TaxID=2547811 RepID=A0ABW8RNA6_9BACI